MTNVKTGDMAIVVNDARPENIGVIVEVGRRSYDWRLPDGGPYWDCTTTGRPFVSRHLGLLGGYSNRYSRTMSALCPDANLRPVSGIPDADDVPAKAVKPKENSRA